MHEIRTLPQRKRVLISESAESFYLYISLFSTPIWRAVHSSTTFGFAKDGIGILFVDGGIMKSDLS